ncbi:ATP-dependent chaperone ClpB [Candidatus Deianiraea vastatrix]|uniref:ATP-dependent chaperone ClpB n=1 Tax=Candidatus Deianiraea vastatrix TaxID=2163644 RepID=UPI0011BF6440
MNFEKYTNSARDLVNEAVKIATSMQHSSTGPEHILQAMLTNRESIVPNLLFSAKCSVSLLREKLQEILDNNSVLSNGGSTPYLSREAVICLTKAEQIAKQRSDEYTTVESILHGMLASKELKISKILQESGLVEPSLKAAIDEMRKGGSANSQDAENQYNALKKYTRNLTELAKNGKIDPVIGRDEEIRRTIQVLSRRIKNNPLLIGEPGVGKTAIIEGLAMRISKGDVPENLKNKTLLELDMALVVAGAKYKGEFEERFKAIINEVEKADGDIVLFIDEIHILMGAGGGGGAMDASNMLKPALARGQMHCIGATTLNEYKKYIEKDPAFARRLQTVFVSQPNVEDAITILRGIKEKYEMHHGVRITDSAIIAAVMMSNKYITDRFLPDKAIDLMDEAASRLKMQIDSKPEKIDNLDRKILQLKIEIEALKKEDDNASKKRMDAANIELDTLQRELVEFTSIWQSEKLKLNKIKELKMKLEDAKFELEKCQQSGNLARAGELRYSVIPHLENEIKTNQGEDGTSFIRETITSDDIAAVISKATGIPLEKMLTSEKEKLLHLEDDLKARVVGQDQAVEIIANAIRRSRSGLSSDNKPIGSFLFLGPTGVGKTELTKAVANMLFNDDKAMLRLDMSEYMEKHSVSRLIGAPPGYVGYDEGGVLTESIRRRPYQVVLFDEVEKAHPDVFNILLQLLDDGRLTDSQGRTADFTNTIVILTSNLGAQFINSNDAVNNFDKMKESVMSEVQRFFRPEFLNRLDEIIFFNRLKKENIAGILDIQIREIEEKLRRQELSIIFQQKAKDLLCDMGYDEIFGARPLKRVLQKQIYDSLANIILQGNFKPGDKIGVGTKDGSIILGKVKDKTE